MSQFKVSAVLFDLDGTLLNTAPQIAEAANAMLVELSLPTLPYAQIKSYIGEGAQMLIQRCLAGALHHPPDPSVMAKAQPVFFAHYANNLTESLPFDGVQVGLAALKQRNLKLACVTNKPERFTLPLLEASGLDVFLTSWYLVIPYQEKSQTLYRYITFVQNSM